jgi:anti-sigma factor RsiW
MTAKPCPPEVELVRFVDADLSEESAERITEHLATCPTCSREVRELRALLDGLAEPPVIELDVKGHVSDVMRRLEQPPAAEERPRLLARVAGFTALAASLALVVHWVDWSPGSNAGSWQARGGVHEESLARNVMVKVYALAPSLAALRPGDVIAPQTPLTAGLRNLGHRSAFLLLFAVDSQNAVHWITPRYDRADDDPVATEVPQHTEEQPLATSVVFDDLAKGPLRIVTLLSPAPLHVSQVERLSTADLAQGNLVHQFAGTAVRELVVQVTDTNRTKAP